MSDKVIKVDPITLLIIKVTILLMDATNLLQMYAPDQEDKINDFMNN